MRREFNPPYLHLNSIAQLVPPPYRHVPRTAHTPYLTMRER
jgi:hypothetical protein